MSHYTQGQLLRIAERAAARKADSARRRCFISYHAEDTDEVAAFLDKFGSEFIAKTVGVTSEDDFIDSEDTQYIMSRIRQKYLGDSTVTIALIGKCTWARRFVDWEIYSSLRESKHSKVNGLMAIELPSVAGHSQLPPRLRDNVLRDAANKNIGYARYYQYPTSPIMLRNWIDDAFSARTTRSHLTDNTRDRKRNCSSCS